MEREVCLDCEKKYIKIFENANIEDVLDWTLFDIDIDNTICLKCLTRITNRYI